MTDRVDAVVIGAGPNGLAAANRLARAGRDVLVLEGREVAGGAVASAELTLPGFVHDTFSAVMPAAVASPVLTQLPLAAHGLQWVHPEIAMAHPLSDGRAAVLADLDRTAASLDDLRPGDGTRWRRWIEPFVVQARAWGGVAMGAFPPVVGGLELVAAVGPSRALDMLRTTATSVSGLADRLGVGDGTRAWLYGTAMHGDVGLDVAGSAIVAVHLHLMGHAVGWPSPRGGAAALATALVGCLEDAGGQLRTGAPVARVVVRGGAVVGVETASGDRVRTPTVVATTTPQALVQLVGAAMPARWARGAAGFTFGPGTLKVDWALSGPTPFTAASARRAGTVHLGGEPAWLAAHQRAVVAGHLVTRPFLLFGQQTVADPSRAPAGQHTAWAYTRVPSSLSDPADVVAHVERMTDQVERFAPGFRDLVLARHVMAPMELQAANPNLVGGDVGGGSQSLVQTIIRPMPALVPYATGVDGLWFGSASAYPGGAVHGVPGWAAAGHALGPATALRDRLR